jgi:polyvinyl alcohol dehydrogenase (cytochrome)
MFTRALGGAARLLSRSSRHRVARGTALAAAACVVAACSATSGTAGGGSTAVPTAPASAANSASPGTASPQAASPQTTGSSTGADWTQYDGNAARTGIATGVPAAGALAAAWTTSLDGAVYGQPLVVGHEVIAATENDSVYALNRATGKTIWRTHVGTPVPRQDLNGCGNIFPLGITGTPIYDPGNGLVYAVAETTGYHHMLVALNATTGAVELHRYLDQPTAANQPDYNQQRPALAIDDGRVYVAFGGLSGDCGAYQGGVVSAPLTGNGPLTSWHTPTSREGAVWGPGGPVVGPDGDLWVSNGNGAALSTADPYDGSDSVDQLSPSLQRLAYFAPSNWVALDAHDQDLGSTQPVLAAGNTVFIMGKGTVGYLLDSTRLGGIGGQVAEQSICKAEGTAAVSGSTVYEPCQSGGMAAIDVSAATKTIKVLWRGPAGATTGSPVLGGGAVWVTSYSPTGSPTGVLYELNPGTGAVQHQISLGQGLPHFSSLSLSGGTAYVSTLTGITAINGA